MEFPLPFVVIVVAFLLVCCCGGILFGCCCFGLVSLLLWLVGWLEDAGRHKERAFSSLIILYSALGCYRMEKY